MKWLISLMASAALLLSACSDEEIPSPSTPADILVGSYTGTLTIGEQEYKDIAVEVEPKNDSVVVINAGTRAFDGMLLDIFFTTQDLAAVNGSVEVGGTPSMVEGVAFSRHVGIGHIRPQHRIGKGRLCTGGLVGRSEYCHEGGCKHQENSFSHKFQGFYWFVNLQK